LSFTNEILFYTPDKTMHAVNSNALIYTEFYSQSTCRSMKWVEIIRMLNLYECIYDFLNIGTITTRNRFVICHVKIQLVLPGRPGFVYFAGIFYANLERQCLVQHNPHYRLVIVRQQDIE